MKPSQVKRNMKATARTVQVIADRQELLRILEPFVRECGAVGAGFIAGAFVGAVGIYLIWRSWLALDPWAPAVLSSVWLTFAAGAASAAWFLALRALVRWLNRRPAPEEEPDGVKLIPLEGSEDGRSNG